MIPFFMKSTFKRQYISPNDLFLNFHYLMAWGMIHRYLGKIKAANEFRNSTPENISTSLCPKFPVSVSCRKNAKLEWVLWMTSPPVTITSCLFGQLHYETHCTYPVVSWHISTYSSAATVWFWKDRTVIPPPPLLLPLQLILSSSKK